MLKTEKIGKLTSAFVSIAICALFILPVSAQYVDMLDHGLFFSSGYAMNQTFPIAEAGGAGTSFGAVKTWVPMWALDSYEPGTTYTMKFSCNVDKSYMFNFTGFTVVNYNEKQTTELYPPSYTLKGAYGSATYDPNTRVLEFTVKFNTDISSLGGYPIYIYLCAVTDRTLGKVTTNQWSTSTERDAGGADYMQSLIDEVAQIRQDNENYHSNALQALDEIKTGIDNMPSEIKTVLEQHDQQNKQEANTEGNDNITQATSALTNALPIASIKDAITPLITACSYNGITSVWSFPALKIPAIQGLFGEMQLSEQQNFDLCAYADQYIPDELLSIIRAVMTILLIVWAIREVMNLLSHLLGGGDG